MIAALAWLWLIARVPAGSLVGPGLPAPAAAGASGSRCDTPSRRSSRSSGSSLAGLAIIPALYLLSVPVAPELRAKLGERPMLWTLASTGLRSDTVHEWMETRAFYLQIGGVAVAALGWLWLIVLAFRQRRAWGWGSLLVPPVGLAFAGRHPRKGSAPLIVLALGLLAAAAPAVYILCVPLDLAERVETGRRPSPRHPDRLGPQGLLPAGLMPDVSVLQMANPDVTDEVLEKLRDMKALQGARPQRDPGDRRGPGGPPGPPRAGDLEAGQDQDHRQGLPRRTLIQGFVDAARPARDVGEPRLGQGLARRQAGAEGVAVRVGSSEDRRHGQPTDDDEHVSERFGRGRRAERPVPGGPATSPIYNEPEGPAKFRSELGLEAKLISVDNTQVYVAQNDRVDRGRVPRLGGPDDPGRVQGLAPDQRQQLPDPARGPRRHRFRRRRRRRAVPQGIPRGARDGLGADAGGRRTTPSRPRSGRSGSPGTASAARSRCWRRGGSSAVRVGPGDRHLRAPDDRQRGGLEGLRAGVLRARSSASSTWKTWCRTSPR